jgi:hypothetical protein
VRPTQFELDIARGLIQGETFTNVHGRNPTTATGDAIWAESTAYIAPVTAELVNVVSTSINDDGSPAGTGAQTIRITGLNELYDVVTEDLTLNGTTNVLTVNKYFNIRLAYVLTAGSTGGQVGTITLISTAAGTPAMGRMAIGANATESSIYQVPRNYTAFFNIPQMSTVASVPNNVLNIGMYKKVLGGVFVRFGSWVFAEGYSGFQAKTFGSPLKFEEKSILLFKCDSAGTSFDVVVDYDIWLIEN